MAMLVITRGYYDHSKNIQAISSWHLIHFTLQVLTVAYCFLPYRTPTSHGPWGPFSSSTIRLLKMDTKDARHRTMRWIADDHICASTSCDPRFCQMFNLDLLVLLPLVRSREFRESAVTLKPFDPSGQMSTRIKKARFVCNQRAPHGIP